MPQVLLAEANLCHTLEWRMNTMFIYVRNAKLKSQKRHFDPRGSDSCFSLYHFLFSIVVYMHISLVPPNPPPQPLSLAVMSAMLEIWYTTLTYLIYQGKCRSCTVLSVYLFAIICFRNEIHSCHSIFHLNICISEKLFDQTQNIDIVPLYVRF